MAIQNWSKFLLNLSKKHIVSYPLSMGSPALRVLLFMLYTTIGDTYEFNAEYPDCNAA